MLDVILYHGGVMVSSPLLFGLLTAVLAVHALIMYRAYRVRERDRSASSATPRRATALIDAEAGDVECPVCGTTNESGYRYCRSCVTELPMATAFERSDDSPLGRVMR